MALKAIREMETNCFGCLFRQIKRQKQRGKRLPQGTDRPADQKGHHAIAQYL